VEQVGVEYVGVEYVGGIPSTTHRARCSVAEETMPQLKIDAASMSLLQGMGRATEHRFTMFPLADVSGS